MHTKISNATIFTLLITAIAVLYSITPIHNGNIFWHLRNGIDIVETGEIRTEDPFTWTRHGAYWIQHEWLAEVALALTWINMGESGPVFLKALFVGLSVFFAFKASIKSGANPSTTFIFGSLWLILAQPRWIVRPHFFSIFFFCLYLYILSFNFKKSWKLTLILLPLQILWVNVHAGFVMGIFLASVPAMNLLLSKEYKKFLNWLIPPVILLLASGIHPNGFRTLEYLPAFLAQPLFKESIREWWSPFHPSYAPEKAISRTALLLVTLTTGTVIALIKSGKKLHKGKLMALLMLLAATVFAARNGELLAPAMLAWVPAMLYLKIPKKYSYGIALILVVIPFVYGVPREIGPPKQLGANVDWSVYPVELADLLENHPQLMEQSILFNTNEISGYLEYRFGEELPMFVDGRCLLFPESFHWEMLMLTNAPGEGFRKTQHDLFNKYTFNLLIYNTQATYSSVYIAAILPEWVPIHINGLTSTYAKKSLLQANNLDSLAFNFFDPLDPSRFLTTPLYLIPEIAEDELLRHNRQMESEIVTIALESLNYRRSPDTSLPITHNESFWFYTFKCWEATRENNYEDAAEWALLSKDISLQSSVSFLQTKKLESDQWIIGITPAIIHDKWDIKSAEIVSYWVTGQQELAFREAEAYIDSLPPWGIAHTAWLYSLAGEQEYAEELAEIALAKAQGPIVLLLAARVYNSINPVLAGSLAVRAIELSPGYTNARLFLGNNLWNRNETSEAAEMYKWILQSGSPLPEYAEIRLELFDELNI